MFSNKEGAWGWEGGSSANLTIKQKKCNVICLPTELQELASKVTVRSSSNWILEMLVFVEGGKPENPEKNPQSRDKNQQHTQPTYAVESGNRTRATLVGGECSHHCAIPAPQQGLGQGVQ